MLFIIWQFMVLVTTFLFFYFLFYCSENCTVYIKLNLKHILYMLFFRFSWWFTWYFYKSSLGYRMISRRFVYIYRRQGSYEKTSATVFTYPCIYVPCIYLPCIYVPCIYVYSVFTEVRKPRIHVQEKFS